jgi:hypothetical protein
MTDYYPSGCRYVVLGKKPRWWWQKDPASEVIKEHQAYLARCTEAHPSDLPKDQVWNEYMLCLNDWFCELHRQLGILPRKTLQPGQLHFMSPEEYSAVHGDANVGRYIAGSGVFYLPWPKYSRFRMMKTIMHEAVHYFSDHRFMIDRRTRRKRIYRVGYGVTPRDGRPTYFRGLNEGVVDLTVLDLYRRHRREIVDLFGFSAKELKEEVRWTDVNSEVVEAIVWKLAKYYGRSEEALRNEFKRHQFTGHMMQFRVIDQCFGPGSLRILSLLDMDQDNSQLRRQIVRLTKDYFSTESFRTRRRIAGELQSLHSLSPLSS